MPPTGVAPGATTCRASTSLRVLRAGVRRWPLPFAGKARLRRWWGDVFIANTVISMVKRRRKRTTFARAAEVEPGRLLLWEMMERVAPAADPLRSRAEQALNFYTSRNLWILWQTLRILKEVMLTQGERRALQWVLSESLWHGSVLGHQAESLWQSQARRPRRFVERNLWNVFHESLAYVQALSGRLRRDVRTVEATADGNVEEDAGRAYHLAQRWPAQVAGRIESGRAALALAVAPPALPLYWLLRWVWSGWLFGAEAAEVMQDLLALRPGGNALAPLLSDAFTSACDWLAPAGRLLIQWRWRGEDDPSEAILPRFAYAAERTGCCRLGARGMGGLGVRQTRNTWRGFGGAVCGRRCWLAQDVGKTRRAG